MDDGGAIDDSNAAGWFVRRGGREQGPIEASQLQLLIAAGRVRSDDEVRQAGDSKWRRVASEGPGTAAPASKVRREDRQDHPSGTSFRDWYAACWLSQVRPVGQVLAWLAYGFVWIPAWYILATRRDESPSVSNKQVGVIAAGLVVVALAGNSSDTDATMTRSPVVEHHNPTVAAAADQTSREEASTRQEPSSSKSAAEIGFDEGYQNGLRVGRELTQQHNEFWSSGQYDLAREVVADVYSLSEFYTEKWTELARYGDEIGAAKLRGISLGVVDGFTPSYE